MLIFGSSSDKIQLRKLQFDEESEFYKDVGVI